MKIIVTGASGLIGSHIIPYLRTLGATLVLVGRTSTPLKAAYPDLESCNYDELDTHLSGADAIVNLAVRNNDQPGTLNDFRIANVDLVKQLVTQSRAAGVRCFCQISTLQAQADDEALHRPLSPYAQSKAEAEAYLDEVTDMNVIVLRLAAVYSEGAYTGKLSLLYKIPAPLRPLAFKLLAALRPTTYADLIGPALFDAIKTACASSARDTVSHNHIMISDGQRENWLYAGVMYAFDLLFVLFVIGALWWLLIAVWIAVKLSSEGPGIFAQERVGKEGKIFKCYKFRTMFKNTKQAGTHDLTTSSITKIGYILRKTKIDELPQVFNILKNEVSLIGPRPCLPIQEELVETRRNLGVLSVKPGISGWAQIQGIDMSNPQRLAETDAAYVALRSIPFDLKIMIATAIGHGQGDKVGGA